MNIFSVLRRRPVEAPCTIQIEHSPQSLHAHVEIDADFVIQPGDEVLVRDAPAACFGDNFVVRRTVTVTRAGPLERAWTRLIGHLELTELYDVSFTERRTL